MVMPVAETFAYGFVTTPFKRTGTGPLQFVKRVVFGLRQTLEVRARIIRAVFVSVMDHAPVGNSAAVPLLPEPDVFQNDPPAGVEVEVAITGVEFAGTPSPAGQADGSVGREPLFLLTGWDILVAHQSLLSLVTRTRMVPAIAGALSCVRANRKFTPTLGGSS